MIEEMLENHIQGMVATTTHRMPSQASSLIGTKVTNHSAPELHALVEEKMGEAKYEEMPSVSVRLARSVVIPAGTMMTVPVEASIGYAGTCIISLTPGTVRSSIWNSKDTLRNSRTQCFSL